MCLITGFMCVPLRKYSATTLSTNAEGGGSSSLTNSLRGQFDVNILSSDVLAAEYNQLLPAGWEIGARGSVSRDGRPGLSDLYQFELSGNVAWRF